MTELTRRAPWGRLVGAPGHRVFFGAWLAALVVATLAMLAVREHLDKAHVALIFLLVVLGGSAAGGRALGLVLAGTSFLLFNYFFLPPFSTFVVTNPLDWLVLLTFLITSAVAAQLLHRATVTTEAATARAAEVDRLAALGAETLNVGRPEDALQAIAVVIRATLDVDVCEVWNCTPDARLTLTARGVRDTHSALRTAGVRSSALDPGPGGAPAIAPSELADPGSLASWIAAEGRSAVELQDGTVRLTPAALLDRDHHAVASESNMVLTADRRPPATDGVGWSNDPMSIVALLGEWSASREVRGFAAPLRVRGRTVGVLRLARAEGFAPTSEQTRFLGALAYFAALGLERVRLAAAVEDAEARRSVETLRNALLTAVSHDIRTPLTTIKGIADELIGGGDLTRARVIAAEVDRLDKLLADLLDLSRIHAGAVRTTVEVNTVDDLIGAALRQTEGIRRGRQIDVDLPPEGLLSGRFDFVQTLRALVNLIENSLKYAPEQEPIVVRARSGPEGLAIEVLDRGQGVPSGEAERIFEAFYRPPGTSPDVRGTGLGLSIARGLAEAQGGTLRYRPREGGGSIFTLLLPASDNAFGPTIAIVSQ